MLTQTIIESKNFTYMSTSQVSPSNDRPDRTDYLAVGTKNKDKKNEIVKVLMLSYDTDGYLTIKDNFNNPLLTREHYVNYMQVLTEAELDVVLSKIKFEITKIDLTTYKVDFI